MRSAILTSLRTRLIVLVLLAVLPALGLTLYRATEEQRLGIANVEETALNLARIASSDQESLLEGAEQLLIALSKAPVIRNNDAVACNVFLASLLPDYPRYNSIVVARVDGTPFCTGSGMPVNTSINLANTVHFQRVLKFKTFVVGENITGRLTNKPILPFAYPVLNQADEVQSVVIATLDVNFLSRVANEAKLPLGSSLIITDRNGKILTRKPDPEKYFGQTIVNTPLWQAIQTKPEGTFTSAGLDGVERLYAFLPLRYHSETVMYLSIGIPLDTALADANRLLVQNLAALGLVIVLVSVLTWVGTNLVLRQVKGLVRATNRLSAGERGVRSGINYRSGEMGTLAQAFDNMVTTLERRETETQEAQMALQNSESQYRALVEQASDGIFVSDQQGNYIAVNSRGCEMLGYSREELLRLTIKDTVTPENVANTPLRLGELIEGKALITERIMRRKDGTTFPVEISARMFGMGNLQAIARDITERKEAQAELYRREQEFRALVDNNPDIITRIDREQRYLYANPAVQAVTGVTPDEIIGKANTDLGLSKWFLTTMQGYVDAVYETRQFKDFELKLSFPEGIKYFQTRLVPEFDKEGKVRTILSVARDVTERKHSEEALRVSEERYRLLFENNPQPLWVFDQETLAFLAINNAAIRHYGYSREEFMAMTIRDIRPPEDISHLLDVTARRYKGPNNLGIWKHRKKDGSIIYVEISSHSIDFSGKEAKLVLANDVTERLYQEDERRRAEEALLLSQEEIRRLNADLEKRVIDRTAQLEAANKELEAFSYSVSHDLRAPLRSIDGFSQVLLEDYRDKLDAEGQDYLNRVRAASQRMAQLIDDMLNLSRVTRSELSREEINLSEIAILISAELQRTEPKRQVEFVIAPDLMTVGDSRLLRILLENLLGNAWKFTGKQPYPRIEFGATNYDGQKAYFVRDNGAGFDMTYASKLFGAFQRLHAISEFPGTGIGLATVQRIVHRHGGRVWAESAVQQGATFYFTLQPVS